MLEVPVCDSDLGIFYASEDFIFPGLSDIIIYDNL